MGKLALHWKILIAMALGVIWSLISGAYGLNGFTSDWIDPFGTIFINILKFIAIPLVLFSIVTGVSGLGDPSQLGRMGAKTLGLYLITTVFSVSMGLVIVNVFVPGENSNKDTKITHRLEYEVWAHDNNIEVKDGRNVMATVGEKELAEIRVKLNSDMDTEAYQKMSQKNTQKNATKKNGPLQPLIDLVPSNFVVSASDNRNMLQVIFFAILFGIAMVMIPESKSICSWFF